MKRNVLTGIASVLALVAAVGCGPKTPAGFPPLQATTLTVTQDGAPLADASITLKSLDSSNTWTSGGTTDAKGVASLRTHGQYSGVPVGKYKVAITKTVSEGELPPPPPFDEASERVYNEYLASDKVYKEFSVVDMQYRLIESTPLEIEVVKGKNALTADVGAAVHEEIEQTHGVMGR